MTSAELARVLAMARCGLSHEQPTNAFVHQVRRLVKVLSPDDAKKFQELLDWHDAGREKSTVELVASDERIAELEKAATPAEPCFVCEEGKLREQRMSVCDCCGLETANAEQMRANVRQTKGA